MSAGELLASIHKGLIMTTSITTLVQTATTYQWFRKDNTNAIALHGPLGSCNVYKSGMVEFIDHQPLLVHFSEDDEVRQFVLQWIPRGEFLLV